MILAERAARLVSEIAVERLKLEVARLRRERFGAFLERSTRIDQLELVLEDLEETLAETEAQAPAP
jgi:transposase